MVDLSKEVFTSEFIKNNVFLDPACEACYDEDCAIENGKEKKYATANFALQSTDSLIELADRIRANLGYRPFYHWDGMQETELDEDGWYDFYIGLSEKNKYYVDDFIEIVVESDIADDDGHSYKYYLNEHQQETTARVINEQLWEYQESSIMQVLREAAEY